MRPALPGGVRTVNAGIPALIAYCAGHNVHTEPTRDPQHSSAVSDSAGVRAETERVIERLRESHALRRLIGNAPSFLRAIGSVPALARGDAAVVINGETGTGKELVARALHYAGTRAAYPFVAVNCGSLTDTLLEDELFGHERGAFTDARTARAGVLLQAERGTLFLDEVDSLTPRAQVALLRVLQDKTFRALGSSKERCADVRFIAATNTPLRPLMRSGAFRSDLFYRLCVLSVDLPPLRERREDILLLARHFLSKHSPQDGHAHELEPSAQRALIAHDWPGNVRELENVIIRAVTLTSGDRITLDDLGLEPGAAAAPELPLADTSTSFQQAKRAVVDAFELDYLTRLLLAHGGNVSSAARAARKERRDLRRLLRKHRLDPQRFTDAASAGVGHSSPAARDDAPPP
jgi:DNA-binding NtrC family response regulator